MIEGVVFMRARKRGLIVWRSGRLCSRARTVPSRGRESPTVLQTISTR